MGFESVRGYVQLASGLGEQTRARAMEAAQGLLSLPGVGMATGKVAGQVAALAEELLAAAATNRENLTTLIRSEVDAAVTRLGLVAAEKLAASQAEAARLRAEVAELRSASARATAAKKSAVRKTAAKKSAVRKTAAKKSAVRKTAAKKATGKKATAKKATAKKTVVKKTAAKDTSATSAAAKPATMATATRRSAISTSRRPDGT
jgi:hypothetical protein